MHACHERRIIHRDLKPANELLQRGATSPTDPEPERTPGAGVRASASAAAADSSDSGDPWWDGLPKITDFGLAKDLDAAARTASGAIVGTPSYMAPEQAAPSRHPPTVSGEGKGSGVGPAADVYALGAILYELLTGRPPFRAADPLDTLLQVIRDEPVPPARLQPRTPPDLERVCLKCLEKEPGKRYASARELAEDLGRFQRGEPVRARPLGRLTRAWRWCRRNPRLAGLAAAVAVSMLAATGVASYFAVRADASARAARAALLEKEAATRRERDTALRFVKFLRRHADLAKLPPEELVARFLEENEDLAPKDLNDAFAPAEAPPGSDVQGGAGEAVSAPNLFGN
jgi:hypothetical protein